MKYACFTLSVAAVALFATPAMAQDWYAGGSVSYVDQSDSDNSGTTGAFTTGNLGDGSTLDVAAGTPYGWNTEFDNGTGFSAEVGARYGNAFRRDPGRRQHRRSGCRVDCRQPDTAWRHRRRRCG